jgi:RNA-directed DNA polymerase
MAQGRLSAGPILVRTGYRTKKHLPRLHRQDAYVLRSKEFSRNESTMKTTIKAHSLTGRITPDLMRTAFRNVKRNRGVAGIDKVSIDMFEANLELNLLALMRGLKNGTYQARPLRRVHIPKGDGKTMRPLGIPAVRDRVAQEVIRQLLSPLFERIFHNDSYGFRPQRDCHQAIVRVIELRQQGYREVLDADIKGFFDNIPHTVIMAGVAAVVADGNILRIVEQFLKAGVMEEGQFRSTTIGTPQGGVISPLLANIALNSLDWQLDKAGCRFVRYADDFVVLCQNPTQLQEAHELVQRHLTQLSLTLSPEKTQITCFQEGFTFLGFDITSRSVTMRPKSVEKFKAKIRELTVRHHNLDQTIVQKVNAVVRGTANYFATTFSSVRTLFRRLDGWLRMRLRAMKFKCKRSTHNWRLWRKHFRNMGFAFLVERLVPPTVGT